MWRPSFSVLLSIVVFIPGVAWAAPGDLCWEQGPDQCTPNFFEDPFGASLLPISDILGSELTVAVLWGSLLGVVWLTSKNIMLVGIVGIFVAGTISGISQEALGIGMLLVAVSIGVFLFQLVQHKIKSLV